MTRRENPEELADREHLGIFVQGAMTMRWG